MVSAKKPQPEKFKELAKEAECDDDEKAFDEKLKRIATPVEKKPAKKKNR